ncbi:hypothetical protein AMJ86_08990 [bacterium SM23_57]|nr:MAG: hypothetical protein AMJ86_08990 [bacterium SM23_57]
MRDPDQSSQWLLDHASPPIRYRVITDVLDGGLEDPDVEIARREVTTFPKARQIASRQLENGSWGNGIYRTTGYKTTGMKRPYESILHQLGRLIEYGWNYQNTAVSQCADKVLIPLLDQGNNTLWELSFYLNRHPELLPFLRRLLRDIALRLLCPAGYSNHPQVKDAITRGLAEIAAFLNHVKNKPLYRKARGKTVMVDGLFFPTQHFIMALAHTDWVHEIPQFRSLLQMYHDFIGQNSPLPDYYLLTKNGTIRHGHEAAFYHKEFYLRHPSFLLQDLETLSHLRLVDRTHQGQWLLDELLAHQDGDGRFRLRNPRKSTSFDYYLLEPKVRGRNIDPFTIDVTFRATLILHHLNYLV